MSDVHRRFPAVPGRPWPLRVRLTAAFASVIALVLAAAGLLIFVQFSHYIDGRTV